MIRRILFSLALLILFSGMRGVERRIPAGTISLSTFNAKNGLDSAPFVGGWTVQNGASISGGTAFVDASNDYLINSSDSECDYDGTESMTIMAWVKRSSGTGSSVILHKGRTLNDSGVRYWSMRTLGSSFAFKLCDNVDSFLLSSSVNVSDGSWHHCVAVLDESTETCYLFVDGTLRNSGDISSIDDCTASESMTLGVFHNPSGVVDTASLRWHGYFDQPMVLGYALSASEIRQIYETGLRAFADGGTP